MKVARRISVNEDFSLDWDKSVPDVPPGGARIKVHYAGATYTQEQVRRSGASRPRLGGYEVSGVLHALGDGANTSLNLGTRVVVFPEEENLCDDGYQEYLVVKNVCNVLPVPEELDLQVAAQLPCGALRAFTTVRSARDVALPAQRRKNGPVSILIVGAGGLSLWTLAAAKYVFRDMDCSQLRVVVADAQVNRLTLAREHGCVEAVEWDESVYEEHLLERTRAACRGSVDIVIDYVSSNRTVKRAIKLLSKGGCLIAGGNSGYDVTLSLHSLTQNEQSLLAINSGSRDELDNLLRLVAEKEIVPPKYNVYPVEEANEVYNSLNHCNIAGRAVFSLLEENAVCVDVIR